MPSLALAYIGDAVYEVFVRTYLIQQGTHKVNHLHKESIGFVSAKAQAEFVKMLVASFSIEEEAVYKRGRNAKSATVPKNADMTDYRMATGFEALIGYLYLKNHQDRLIEILTKILEFKEGNVNAHGK